MSPALSPPAPATSNGPSIEVEQLVIRYGTRTAVDGVSFSARGGEVLALLGPNGAGKTSTVECLEGYRRPASGTVRVLGLDPRADAAQLAPRIGVMLQRNGAYLTMGPADMLRLFSAYYGSRGRDPGEVLDEVGLRSVAGTPWRRLSGGEQQRLSLGMALVGRPEVAFLDEPTAGMDPAARQVLWGVIRRLRDGGACVMLTTHYLEEAQRLADRVVILDHGRVVADGSPAELMNSSVGDEIRFGAPPGLDLFALSSRLGAPVHESPSGEYVASVPPTPRNVADLTSWLAERNLPLSDLRAGRQTLEDVYMRLTTTTAEQSREADSEPPGRRRRGRRS